MKLKRNKILIIFLMLLAILLLGNSVNATEIKKGNYSKKYEEWLQLPDEEKEKTIAPLAFNIRSSKKSLVDKFRNLLKSSAIPNRYDLREHINVEVKNQMNTGACWAFSANTTLETNLELHNKTYNFSERHIDYDTAKNYLDGNNEDALNRNIGAGGYFSTAFTYYSRGSGPILEDDMPFINNEYSIRTSDLPRNIAVKKVDNMVYFPSIFKRKDENGKIICEDGDGKEYSNSEINEIRNDVKKHIMDYGGITINILSPNSYYDGYTHCAYMNENETYSNHSVTIIGWDDNFSKDNFINKPSIDGAYIVLNSWGDEWGDNGVYYISYEDFLVESAMRGVTSVSDIEYDNLYQHDVSEMWNYIKSKYAANVFSAKENGKLTQVMIGSLSDQTCNIYISVEENEFNMNSRIKVANDVSLKPGYNTINLAADINVTNGKKFAVIVELTNDNFEGIGIEDSTAYFGNVVSNTNESFISSNGSEWNDIYDTSNMMNFSIKAYTQDEQKTFKLVDIKGQAYENLGGEFSIVLDTSYIEDGNTIDINIYNGNQDITSMFNIINNKVKGKGAYITIECPSGIKKGNYKLSIGLSNYNTIYENLEVLETTNEYLVAKFNDVELFNYAKANMNNYLKNSSEMRIIASREEFEKVDTIIIQYKNLEDLTGIEYFTNLKLLIIDHNKIADISKISNLSKLEEICLDGNNISDFSALDNLYNLRILEATDNNINNLSFLREKNKLEILNLGGSASEEPIDISKIFNLEKLKDLNLTSWTWITENELQNIKNLNNLTGLTLQSCSISNIDFLRDIDLSYLSIGNDVLFLGDHNSKKGNSNITDFAPIENMISLNQLRIRDMNTVFSIDFIEHLAELSDLEVTFCSLEDASILDNKLKNRSWKNLVLQGNIIEKRINVKKDCNIIIEIPQIIQQTCNRDSILYCENELDLFRCNWNEYGKSIIIDTSIVSQCEVQTTSGYAGGNNFRVIVNPCESCLEDIQICKEPDKIKYKVGDNFNKKGMQLLATYSDGSTDIVDNYTVVDGTNLNSNQTSVTIRYTDGETTKEITQDIIVENERIEVTKLPDDVVYMEGDNFDSEGMIVTYIDRDGNTQEIENYTIQNGENLYKGQPSVTIVYNNNPDIKAEVSIVVYSERMAKRIYFQDKNLYNAIKTKETVERWVNNYRTYEIKAFNDNNNSVIITNEDIAVTASLDLSNKDIKKLDGLEQFENLHNIYLTGNQHIDSLQPLFNLENLRYINLLYTNIEDIDVLLNKDSVEEIEIFKMYDNIINITTTKLQLPDYIYQIVKSQNNIKISALVNDIENEIKMDDKNKVAYMVLNDGYSTINIHIEGGKIKIANYQATVYKPVKGLTGISITTEPTRKSYIVGQNFDKAGMVVTASYNDGSSKEITNYTVTDGESLTAGKTNVTISYTENGVTKTATQNITVVAKELTGIIVTTAPNRTSYVAGQNFDKAGMVVTASYNDGSSKEITNYTVTDGNNLTAGKTNVTISYTENEITKTTEHAITVVGAEILFKDLEIYEKDNNSYIKISPLFTTEELASMMDQEALSNNTPYYENLTEDGKLRTGTKIMLNGEEKYIVVVKGDTNGDGIADIKDMIKINNYRLYGTITNFEGIYQDAADVNKDGSIDIKDMIRINNYRLYGTEF